MSKLTIMMPCYNAEPYLKDTIDSLKAQGDFPWELVVVDDGSTDRSIAVISEQLPQAKILKGSHQGIGRALNLALPHAESPYFAWIDADDLWAPGKLKTQFQGLRDNPGWDGCFVSVEQFYHQPQPGSKPPAADGKHRGALLIKREAFERVGPFREDIKIGEFVDWCARAHTAGLHLGVLPQKLYRRRIHETNTMKSDTTDKRDYLKVLKAHLDRKRRQGS